MYCRYGEDRVLPSQLPRPLRVKNTRPPAFSQGRSGSRVPPGLFAVVVQLPVELPLDKVVCVVALHPGFGAAHTPTFQLQTVTEVITMNFMLL